MTRKLSSITIKEFRAFLEFHGLNYHHTKGGHEIWSKKALTRPVTFQTHIDPIPPFIISNNLRVMGLTSKDLRDYLESNRKKRK